MNTRILAFAVVVLGFAAGPAVAQGTQEQREACTSDAFRLCGAFIPDASRIEQCLAASVANLTPACRAQFVPQNLGKRASIPGTTIRR